MIIKFKDFINEDGYAASASNTTGMGNITNPSDKTTGSGDLLDNEKEEDEDEKENNEIKDKE